MQYYLLRVIDIYLFITGFVLLTVLFSNVLISKRKSEERPLPTALLVLFILHITVIALSNFEILLNPYAGQIGYLINLSYGPVFLTFFLKKDIVRNHRILHVLSWVTLGLIMLIIQPSRVVYESLILTSFIGNLSLVCTYFLKTASTTCLTGWEKFLLGFFGTLTITYVVEIGFLPSESTITWQMRFIYFTEIMALAFAFYYFTIKSKFSMNLQSASKVRFSKVFPDEDPTASKEIALLVHLLEKDQLFKDPDLSRTKLTKQTGISSNRISELINKQLDVSFVEWVNTYRIEAAKEMLISNKNESVKEIFYGVGFNSKSAFNTAFKKVTGQTPTDFRASN